MKKKSYGNAFIVSCTLHLVGLLLGTLYIVQNEIYELILLKRQKPIPNAALNDVVKAKLS